VNAFGVVKNDTVRQGKIELEFAALFSPAHKLEKGIRGCQ